MSEKPMVRKRAGEPNGTTTNDDKKRSRLDETTDRSRWRMRDDQGRLTWHYLEDEKAAKEWPQTAADKWYLGIPLVNRTQHGGYTVDLVATFNPILD
jgi:lanosterol synthase